MTCRKPVESVLVIDNCIVRYVKILGARAPVKTKQFFAEKKVWLMLNASILRFVFTLALMKSKFNSQRSQNITLKRV